MAFPKRGGAFLSAPGLLTVIVSLVLVGAALVSLRVALPGVQHLVAPHRLALLVAGYGVLLAGVVLRRL